MLHLLCWRAMRRGALGPGMLQPSWDPWRAELAPNAKATPTEPHTPGKVQDGGSFLSWPSEQIRAGRLAKQAHSQVA